MKENKTIYEKKFLELIEFVKSSKRYSVLEIESNDMTFLRMISTRRNYKNNPYHNELRNEFRGELYSKSCNFVIKYTGNEENLPNKDKEFLGRFMDGDVHIKHDCTFKAYLSNSNVPNGKCEYVAYTFGDIESPFSEIGGAAYIIIRNNRVVYTSSKLICGYSANKLSLLAIMSAINWIPKGASIEIRTENKYCTFVLSDRFEVRPDTKNANFINNVHKYAEGKTVVYKTYKPNCNSVFMTMVKQLAMQEMYKAHEEVTPI